MTVRQTAVVECEECKAQRIPGICQGEKYKTYAEPIWTMCEQAYSSKLRKMTDLFDQMADGVCPPACRLSPDYRRTLPGVPGKHIAECRSRMFRPRLTNEWTSRWFRMRKPSRKA